MNVVIKPCERTKCEHMFNQEQTPSGGSVPIADKDRATNSSQINQEPDSITRILTNRSLIGPTSFAECSCFAQVLSVCEASDRDYLGGWVGGSKVGTSEEGAPEVGAWEISVSKV